MTATDHLNEHQHRAVAQEAPIVLVNAAVGSGKTTVLIHKVADLVAEKNISPDRLLVLTFTNKAAREIGKRLSDEDGANLGPLPYCGTFHGVANRLLRDHFDLAGLGYQPNFSILDERESKDILLQICREENLKVKHKNRLARRLDKFRQFGEFDYHDDFLSLMEAYQRHKVSLNAMDFHDLIYHVDLLLQSQELPLDWVVVDEFQDTDDLQGSILKRLIDQGANLFAVGDPHQCIYSWRGSSQKIFHQFRRLDGAVQLDLPINYRSTSTILEGVQALLEGDATIEAHRNQGTPITIRSHHNSFQEAGYLAGRIQRLVNDDVPLTDIAVLYRRQKEVDTLQQVFRKKEVPFHVRRKRNLKDFPVLEWLVALLQVAVNPRDKERLRWVLKHRHYGPYYRKRLVLKKADHPLVEAIHSFATFLEEPRTAEEIDHHLGLDEYLKPTALTYEKDRHYVSQFLEGLVGKLPQENFGSHFRRAILATTLDLDSLVEEVEGYSPDGVQLMTLHASKGLEFPYVFIIGANHGNIPLIKDDEDEEKRLFFVGLTRAKDYVEVSFTFKPSLPRVFPRPSPYLDLLPSSVVQWKGRRYKGGGGSRCGGQKKWGKQGRRKKETTQGKSNLHDLMSKLRERREEENKSVETAPCGHSKKDTVGADPRGRPKKTAKKTKTATHEKYGRGVVVYEDDDTVRVDFDGYGEKEFSKVFCPLTFE